ncbi:MAG: M48 family metallopeptidase [bacterium]
MQSAKKYNNIKLAVGIGKGVLSFFLILLFVALGYSEQLEIYLRTFSVNDYLVFILFVIVTGLAVSILFFPVNYYSGFYLEHKYNLSNQTFLQWVWENFKAALVAGVIGLPLLVVFYFVINYFGSWWWLPFAVIMFVVSVLLARIVPVIILPIFYKITPLENEDLKERILRLAGAVGMKVENVFKFNMSKETKKANAAFTGLGKTKRILLGDTLLDSFTNDEIETVIAHELGHYKHKHIIKNIFIGTFFSFATFFLMAVFYDLSISWFGFSSINQIAALPILSLWGMLIGLSETPITNWISRKYEYQADEYAVTSTKLQNEFINTLEKLTDQNLSDREPHPFVEWFFYSHPSIKKRKEYILTLNQFSDFE